MVDGFHIQCWGFDSTAGQTFERMSNELIKLCFDGMYKLCRHPFAILTLGALLKDAERNKPQYGEHRGFPTTFYELCLAIGHAESNPTYSFLIQAFKKACRVLCNIEVTDQIVQVHGDRHVGLRAALREQLPGAKYQSDFAHVIGAVRRPPLKNQSAEGQEITRWRKGLFTNVKEVLRNEDLMETMESLIHSARFLTSGLFSLHMMAVLQWLENQDPPELRAASVLRKQYLQRCAARLASSLKFSFRVEPLFY